jgi:hypothetical protein
MSTIVTRAGKGSALTHNEVDANFTNLNTDKIQSGNTVASLTITSATINGGTITGITDLAIADGGTGSSTAVSAFNALSPTTTKGDLIVSNGSDNVRLPVGTNNYVLTADSSEATGVKWSVSGGGMVDPGANGVVVRTALNTTTARTITAGTGISVSNGNGVSANPTITNSGVTSLTGTANEVEVSASTGAITVSLPSTINANTTGNAANVTGVVAAANGGTGQSSYAVGDLLYASTTTALSKLADVATGNALISGGVGVAPSYGKIGLTTHVSGTLPVTNGGTGITSFGAGIATFLGTPSSANLAAAVTNETGSGALVFATSPTLVTPLLGTPTSGNLANCTFPTLNQNTTGSAATVTGNATGSTFGFNSGYGSVATAYGCRAWVNFNGTGTVAIRASGNVSSITDNGTGDYTVNFTTAMPDANYAFSICAGRYASTFAVPVGGRTTQPTTSSMRIYTTLTNGSEGLDPEQVAFSVFR